MQRLLLRPSPFQKSTQRTSLGKVIIPLQTIPYTFLAVGTNLRILDFEFCLVGWERGSVGIVVRMIFWRKEGGEVFYKQGLIGDTSVAEGRR